MQDVQGRQPCEPCECDPNGKLLQSHDAVATYILYIYSRSGQTFFYFLDACSVVARFKKALRAIFAPLPHNLK